MTYRNGLSSPLATLVENEGGHALSMFGGTIFTQAGRSDIGTLRDLRGKTLATSGISSLGSYQMQAHELAHAGVSLPQDATVLETGQPQDRAIEAVLVGRADAGFVRTGVIEAMVREGRLDASALKIVNSQTSAAFPYLRSTRLYPEWAIAAMPDIDGALALRVAAALLTLPHGGELAQGMGIQGFTIPANYHPVDDMLRELRLPPFDVAPEFSAGDVWNRYRGFLAVGLVGWSLILLVFALRLWRYNRRLKVKSAELRQSMNQLLDSETRQKAILHALGEGVCGADSDGRCSFINATALAMLQLNEQEVLGQDLYRLLHRSSADDRPVPASQCQSCLSLQDGLTRSQADWFLRKDGVGFPVWLTATPLIREQPSAGVIVAFRDISQDKAAEAELRKLSQAVEQSPVSIVITDLGGGIEYVNEFFVGNTGYRREELIGQNPRILSTGDTPATTYLAMWESLSAGATWQGEFINKRKDGSEFVEHAIVSPIRNAEGEIEHYLAVKQDITERKTAEDEIRYLAFYDSLTHLPNRRLLIERLRQALGGSASKQGLGALLLIDLDNFKTLNDTHGHAIGDILLQQIAPWIAGCLRPDDTLARLGGDEFVVMLESLGETATAAEAEARLICEKMNDALNQTFHFGEHEHHSSASVGVALFGVHSGAGAPDLDETIDTLLRQTDLAMYQAKAAGRNTFRFFDSEMQAVVSRRAALETDLRQGLVDEQFILYYQAQVDARGRLTGAEALVRWQHPKRGMVSPVEFIPLAEDTGLILPLGQWVLETACRQLAVWARQEATSHLSIAVNVSALQLRRADFVSQVLAVLERTAANPCRLKLELTESLLLDNVEEVIEKMRALKARGVGFSLDDFGTGYSSLSYLKRLPLDQLKIDQSFVRDVLFDPNDAAIARTIVALAQSLGLAVIAEGVETEAQRKLLAEFGCLAYQGYLFGRPGPVAALPCGLA
jgi:diguanylate cyclase (GGDEF)-like protein/PAS domain S-box-containing protein